MDTITVTNDELIAANRLREITDELDSSLAALKAHSQEHPSRSLSLAITKTEEALLWLRSSEIL